MLKGFVSGEEKDIVRIPMKGKNLVDESKVTLDVYLSEADGKTGSSTVSDVTDYIDINASPLVISGVRTIGILNSNTRGFCFYDSNKKYIRGTSYSPDVMSIPVIISSIPANAKYVRFAFDKAFENGIMLNLGSTALPYEPYGYQEGWEVRDNQDRLIWGREDELEGTDSIPIKGYGTPLTSVTIKGNGQQNGTPSPQNIVPFDGTGERTGNLWDKGVPRYVYAKDYKKYNQDNAIALKAGTYTISSDGKLPIIQVFDANHTQLNVDDTITLSSGYYEMWDGLAIGPQSGIIHAVTITLLSDYILTFVVTDTLGTYIMLNLGSTALPYEPYGYKIPITCAGQTVPVYLGQTQTVRKIQKLVLDGTENWQLQAGVTLPYFRLSDTVTDGITGQVVCTHYVSPNSVISANNTTRGVRAQDSTSYGRILIIRTPTNESDTVQGFKSYLAQQYASGTPVVVWYVLATEQTGIVNEPLMKIGDYSDTLTTDTPIPTTTGATDVTVDTKIPPSELTIKVHAKKIRYGFKIDKSQENSESAVIYTHDAVTMTPAVMDFTNDRFSYGSWENAWFVRDARPCALKLDGTVAYYLDPNDATKKLDGTASDIYYELLSTEPADWSTQWKQYYTKSGDDYTLNDQAEAPTFATDTYYKLTYNSSFTGNFMVEFPQVWFYRHEDSSYNYIEISNYKLSDDWKCYSHINKDGTLVDRIYLPMFKGVIKDSKLRSLPGQIPQGNTTATDEVNAATALGSRWQIWDHSSIELINDLLTLMSKSIDSQGRFGKGRESGYNSSDTVTYGKLQTGTLVKKGKFHGYSSSYKEVKVFGIEGFWANRWDRLQGMLLVNNVWKIKMTPPYNFTGTDFVTLSNAEVPSGNGYLSKVQTSEYGSIPASIANGSSTKYFKDYFYKTATDTRVALRGGGCYSGSNAGFRCVSVGYAASHSRWDLGASPVYK